MDKFLLRFLLSIKDKTEGKRLLWNRIGKANNEYSAILKSGTIYMGRLDSETGHAGSRHIYLRVVNPQGEEALHVETERDSNSIDKLLEDLYQMARLNCVSGNPAIAAMMNEIDTL